MHRFTALVVGVSVAGSLLAVSFGHAAAESLESQREVAAALEAERSPAALATRQPLTGPLKATVAPGVEVPGPLFVGVDDDEIPAFRIDPSVPASVPVPLGVAIWGAAYDPASDTVYISSGSTLNAWVVGAPAVTPIGTITDADGGATLAIVSLAFTSGTLYGTRNLGTEGLYAIDTTTAVATLVAAPSEPTEDIDIGGLAAHPVTGVLYGTNDDAGFGRGLVTIALDGTITFVAPYPDGQTDLDGLAIGNNGRAYLIPDEPGNIYVFDLAGGVYETPIPNPWTTSEVFSAGAWIEQLIVADLQVTKSTTATAVALDQTFEYLLTVVNGGPGAATGVRVIDTLPPQLAFVGSDCGAGAVGQVVTWNVGALALNGSALCNVTVQVVAPGTIVNTTVVSADQPDPDPSDNSSTVTVAGAPPFAIPTLDWRGVLLLSMLLGAVALRFLRS